MSGGGMSFGAVPDMLMGKDPKKAILDNMKMAAMVGTGMAAAPAIMGAQVAGDAFMPAGLGTGGANAPVGLPGLTPSGSAGLLGDAGKYAKPAMEGMNALRGLMGGDTPMPPPPSLPSGQLDLSSILQANQMQMQGADEEEKRRREQLQQYTINMMGGSRG